MRYIDSNLFIYAALSLKEKGKKARSHIKKIRKGNTKAVTSVLTFDEVFWKVQQGRGFESALKIGKTFLQTNNLMLVEVNDEVLWRTYNLIEKYELDSRDGIHLACALEKGVHTIISEDEDFDQVKEIDRKWIL